MEQSSIKKPKFLRFNFSLFYGAFVYKGGPTANDAGACSGILLAGRKEEFSTQGSDIVQAIRAIPPEYIPPTAYHAEGQRKAATDEELKVSIRKVLPFLAKDRMTALTAAQRVRIAQGLPENSLLPQEEHLLDEKYSAMECALELGNRETTEDHALAYLAAALKIAVHYSSGLYIANKQKKNRFDSMANQYAEAPNFKLLFDYIQQELSSVFEERAPSDLRAHTDLFRAGAQHWKREGRSGSRIFFAGSGEPEEILPAYVTPRESDDPTPTPLAEAIAEGKNRHFFLLGQGGVGKTTAIRHLADRIYNLDHTCPLRKITPLYVDLSTAPDVGGPAYTGGKSSFIRRSIYTRLCAQRQTALPPLALTADEAIIRKNLDPLLTQRNTNGPAILLLLDGINEMSRRVPPGADVPVAVMVQREIADIAEFCPNVRIVLAGRVDDGILDGENILRYDLCELTDEIIRRHLTAHLSPERTAAVMANPPLLSILRLPLFLSIFVCLKDTGEADTQGELLHIFFGERKTDSPIYTTRGRNRQIEENLKQTSPDQEGRLTAELQAFIIDFILPEIAWQMEDRVWIHGEGIGQAINRILDDKSETAVRSWAGAEVFAQYRDPYNPEKHTDRTAQLLEMLGTGRRNLTDKVLAYCRFNLGILQHDRGNYRFSHQIFQDYFAAVKVINAFRIAAESNKIAQSLRGAEKTEKEQAAFACLADVLGKAPLDTTLRRMIGEILGEHRNAPLCRDGKWILPSCPDNGLSGLCRQMLDVCRGQQGEGVGYTVFNLVQIMRESRGGDLSGLDFSGLDLRRCALNGARLARPGLPAKFAGAQISRDTLFPTGHTSFICTVAYHPDPAAHMLITASCDRTAKIWDTRTGVCMGTLRGHEGTVTSASFHPRDPRYALTSSYDGTAKIWDCETFECVQTIRTHQGGVVFSSAAFCPDGSMFAAISDNRTIKLFEPDTQREYVCSNTLEEYPDDLGHIIRFSPNGRRILTLYGEKFNLRVWHKTEKGWSFTETDADRLGLNGIKDAVFHPNGDRILVSPMLSSSMIALDADTLDPLRGTETPQTPFAHAAYTPDGKKIVSIGNDFTVLDAENHHELLRIPDLRRDTLLFCPCAISPDGNFVAFDNGAAVEIREIKTGAVHTLLGGFWRTVNSAAYHPSGRHFITAGEDGAAVIWSAHDHSDDRLPPYRCTTLLLQENGVKLAGFHPNSEVEQLLTVSRNGKVHLWNIPTEDCTAAYTEDFIHHASYSLDGSHIMLSAFSGIGFALWNAQTGELSQSTYRSTFAAQGRIPIRDKNGSEKTVTRYLSISGDQDDLCLWRSHVSYPDRNHSLEKEEIPRGLPFPVYNRYNTAAFSHNGKMVLAGQYGGRLTLYDSLLKDLLCTVEMEESVSHLCFSPNDTRVVVATIRTISLWDIRGEELVPSQVPPYSCSTLINSVTFSPDGKHILTALSDGTCRILDAETLACLQTIPHITGLFVRGVDLSHAIAPDLTEEDRDALRLYGAELD